MADYTLQDVSFIYAGSKEECLANISITIKSGEFVLLCGPSGSGKTTLLRQLKKEVCPEGQRMGRIEYDDEPLEKLDTRRSVQEIGMVFQNPDNQIIMHTVWQELAFGMENMGYNSMQIQRSIAEIVTFFGMESWLQQEVHQLSGGQKQLLNLAAVMILRPKVLLLDEPTAQLDPIATKEFLSMVKRINEELSITIIMSEHRLEEVFPLANKVYVLENGRIQYEGTAKQVIAEIGSSRTSRFKNYLPIVSKIYLALEKSNTEVHQIPVTIKEGKRWVKDNDCIKINKVVPTIQDNDQKGIILSCANMSFQYEKYTKLILNRINLDILEGEVLVILGGNGAGKSTLLKNIVGILKPQKGYLYYKGKKLKQQTKASIGYLAQNPMLYFNRETVKCQLEVAMIKALGHYEKEMLEEIITLLGIEHLLERHPYDISGGEQQKVALAIVLLTNPDILLLDEPTKGLDPGWKMQFGNKLMALKKLGKTVVMVSHDVEFAAEYGDRCGLMFDGEIVCIQPTRTFFRNNYFYTTVTQRMLGDCIEGAICMGDVVG